MTNRRLEAFQALEYVPFVKEKKKKDIHLHKHKYTYTMLYKIIKCSPRNSEGQGSLDAAVRGVAKSQTRLND